MTRKMLWHCATAGRKYTIMANINIGRMLIGSPLETKDLAHQSISKKVGLAVFASDALSSTAYATEEILIVLALAGGALWTASSAQFLGLSIPIADRKS